MEINLREIRLLKSSNYQLTIEKNNKEEKYKVSEQFIFTNQLFKPKTISKDEYSKLISKIVFDNLYIKAINFISYQMRTISEVKKKIQKDTTDKLMINKVIEELKSKKYLNDDYYAKEFIQQKMEYDLVGPKYIKEKLIGKGIHFDLIDKYLVNYKQELEFDKISTIIDNETKYPIKKPLNKAILSIKKRLINKGFSMNVVNDSIKHKKKQISDVIDDGNILSNEFIKLKKRYDITTYEGKDKVVKSLLAKGYDYSKIKSLFE